MLKAPDSVTEQALSEKHQPLTLVNEYMVPAMDKVGRRFESQEYSIPELLLGARAMKACLELVRRCFGSKSQNQLAGLSSARSKEICMTSARIS